jgi:putative ATPase
MIIDCPICSKNVKDVNINSHIDSGCESYIVSEEDVAVKAANVPGFFNPPSAKRASITTPKPKETRPASSTSGRNDNGDGKSQNNGLKRPLQQEEASSGALLEDGGQSVKKAKLSNLQQVAPLAERMRPLSLDEVCGQTLVGRDGLLRRLIAENRVPSMILWGGPGTGKTTIARLIAHTAKCRFVEINATSSGIPEVKKLFVEAKNELAITGRKTIIFCDEIHRFNKTQQDAFLGPVESGQVTLIGATTENPSFKVIKALMSRCQTFTLAKLTDKTLMTIMERAIASELGDELPPLLDKPFLEYLAAYSDGDARRALSFLELAINLSKKPDMTQEILKKSTTQTLVYDRNGDQHYDTISAFHKSIRGSNVDAALYYLSRMLNSGEDPLYIARRLIVIASEDIGLADNSMISLATATHTACEKVGMPECRINLAHATVAFARSPKSTRAYRAFNAAMAALQEPGVAGFEIPLHLRNKPTQFMEDEGYGKGYKYNPDYVDGRVKQEYFPEKLKGVTFLEDIDLGRKVDPDVDYGN